MVEGKLQLASGVAAAISAGLGFVAPWPSVLVGLFFATAGGFAGMVVSPPAPEERMGISATLLVAIVMGIAAGLAHPHFADLPWLAWISTLPLQLVMLLAGLVSRWAARRLVAGDFSPPFKFKGGDGHA